MEDLGPLYIKVGQMLSTRPDICPEYLMTEFENLHAKVSVSPFTDFEPVLEDELGGDWKRYFRDIDTEPIGCASLAQVYKVQLKSGKNAVVKIQRPGVRQDMLEDMALLGKVVRRLAKRMPDLNEVLDLEAMLDVVFTSMRPELDFTLEGENMDDFRDRVADFDTLKIPEVLFATPRVLVQGLAKGKSIRDFDKTKLTPEQCETIGRELLAFMFWGFFVDRKFHADPHPGNVFISDDGEANIIDWGMVGQVDLNLAMSLIVVLLSMGMGDGTTLARSWIEMGRATKRADIGGFVGDMGRFVPGIAGQSLERFNFGVQLSAILKYSTKRGIATSPMIAILGKAFANVEGSIRYLAPELSITDVFEDEFKSIAQELARAALGKEAMARQAAQAFLMAFQGPGQVRSILADMANRDTTMRLGEDMGMRSRHEDRADARARAWRRAALAAGGAAYLMERKRRG
ncbi:MAG: AarF/ABC1/UbiB kinase family protein [Sporichthya sp.]|nr:AarF/ABC1/UbiB kinase family protein [Sporichthya sp.]